MSRLAAYGIGCGLLVAVALPGFRDARDDSYPLSTYPMFARPRGLTLVYFAEGVDRQRNAVRLPPALVANEEVMQAAARVRRAVQGGKETALELCRNVAQRAAASPKHEAVVRVQIVEAKFDPVVYFEGRPEPLERTVHARCRVKKNAASRR